MTRTSSLVSFFLSGSVLDEFLFPVWILVGSREFFLGWADPPDLRGILGDGAVAGELPGGGDVHQSLPVPRFRVLQTRRYLSDLLREKGRVLR